MALFDCIVPKTGGFVNEKGGSAPGAQLPDQGQQMAQGVVVEVFGLIHQLAQAHGASVALVEKLLRREALPSSKNSCGVTPRYSQM